MKLSAKGAADIRLSEGFVPNYYLDPVGIPTIGIGFTWASSAFKKWWAEHRPEQKFQPGVSMTRAEADSALVYLSETEYGEAVNKFLGDKDVPQNVFDAMVSVVYNCGPGTLSDKWAQAAKAGKYKEAAELLKTTRVTAKGKRLQGLVNRREDEARLLLDGKYNSGGVVTYVKAAPDPMDDGLLMIGERGEAILDMQNNLIRHGLNPGKPDGIFGHGTQSALMDFQRSRGLKPDGIAGPRTLAALGM